MMNACDRSDRRMITVFRIAAILSFFLGYIYLNGLWEGTTWTEGILLFALLLIAGTELFAGFTGRTYSVLKAGGAAPWESILFAVCVAAQAAAAQFYDQHTDFGAAQFLMLHVTGVLYILARTGMFSAGKTGPLLWLDLIQGFAMFPFGNIHLSFVSLFKRTTAGTGPDSTSVPLPSDHPENIKAAPAKKHSSEKWLLAAALLFALIVAGVVWHELAGVSESFSHIDLGIVRWLQDFYRRFLQNIFDSFLPKFLFSIPISAWLFGLVGGTLSRTKPYVTEEEFRRSSRPWHVFPSAALYIVSGILCALYVLFFAVSMSELFAITQVTAPEACRLAVRGFWQLVRIVCINIALLGVYALFLKETEQPAGEVSENTVFDRLRGPSRILVTLQFVFTTAFGILAAWKLFGLYIGIFGPTPRRMLAGWFLCVLLLACIFILIRLYKKTAAARIVILTAAVSFSILCCLPVEAICG